MVEDTARDYKVEDIIQHQDYDRRRYYNDIALLKLTDLITLSNDITPICIPRIQTEDYVNEKAFAVGWGVTKYGKLVITLLDETSASK